MSRLPVYITDIIEEVVIATSSKVLSVIQANETAVFGETNIQQIGYSKSSFDELIETLSQKDGSSSERFNKYPLIHLVRDFSEERGELLGVYAGVSLNLVIIHQTQMTYKITDRENQVFKPVLYPIYYELINQLEKSRWTLDTGDDCLRHRKTDRAFWGNRNLTGQANKLNDYVDAIEVQNLQLKINYSC
jgi:hypothetical protein